MKNKYARVFAIVGQINNAGADVTYKELLKSFTNGRTDSLSKLEHWELQEFERSLMKLQGENPLSDADYLNDPLNATRRAIIAQFKSIGRTASNAIEWAEKYGVNGRKKRFNDYNGQELFVLLQNAKKVKADFIKSINKKLV